MIKTYGVIFIGLYDFVNGTLGLKSGLVNRILELLRKIRSWFENQRRYNFYGSSILITYDAYKLEEGEDPKVQVRMIDFSYVLSSTAKDENYIGALEKLIKVFLVDSIIPYYIHS